MTVWETALRVYASEPCPRTLEEDLRLVMANPWGYVLKDHDIFLIARPVNSKAPAEKIVHAFQWFDFGDFDCWHVHLLVGDARVCFQFMPFKLPLVSFERQNVLRFYNLDRIRTLIHTL